MCHRTIKERKVGKLLVVYPPKSSLSKVILPQTTIATTTAQIMGEVVNGDTIVTSLSYIQKV